MVIKVDHQPVGYFCLTFSYSLEYYGRDCFLDEIYIKPEFQHRGIGSKTIQFIEKYLISNRFKAVHLIVLKRNKNARCFYLKNHFNKHKTAFMTGIFKDNEK